ncbi:unnamed protein product [Leptidea sinapis]|uniref:Epoxide hydrolase N-terminal domain-containing protein n=1 Tax=Leptidea sinapis TaxID=189913 RepID=A0A5E4QBZ1_9NEOP|nr:unnamed protein product [Leptidea sinapis]
MSLVPEGTEVVPLLLLHGWPGSFVEFYEAIPALTAVRPDRNFALELIIPSLPGYGFSSEVIGFHTNLPLIMSSKATFVRILGAIYPPLLVSREVEDRKFSTWVCPDHRYKQDGGLPYRFTKDRLIDNLMVYWTTNTITTSMRLYKETFNSRYMGLRMDDIPTSVPTWVTQAKYEVSYTLNLVLKSKYPNLVNETILDDGGHFLAMELPEIFSNDVLKAIGEFRKLNKEYKKTEL